MESQVDKKKKKQILGYLLRFSKFSLILIVFLTICLAVGLLLGPKRIAGIQNNVDNTWWIVSGIRWILIAIIIWYLPKYSQKINHRKMQEYYQLQDDIKQSEEENASNETIAALEMKAFNTAKLARAYQLLGDHYYYAAALFIALELLAVQLPHLI